MPEDTQPSTLASNMLSEVKVGLGQLPHLVFEGSEKYRESFLPSCLLCTGRAQEEPAEHSWLPVSPVPGAVSPAVPQSHHMSIPHHVAVPLATPPRSAESMSLPPWALGKAPQ